MAAMGLPVGFIFTAVAYLIKGQRVRLGTLDGVEFFAGVASWTKEMRNAGLKIGTFELQDGQDILSAEGLLLALELLLSCKPGGIAHWATVCSSWVTINRGTSQRSPDNVLGNERYEYIRLANIMVSRTALAILFGLCFGVHFVLEQPLSSLMFSHPRVVQIVRLSELGIISKVEGTHIYMGMFGHWCPKPTRLLSSLPWISKLRRKLVRDKFQSGKKSYLTSVDDRGIKRFQGSQHLKSSQAYPSGYGAAFALHFVSEVVHIEDVDDKVVPCCEFSQMDTWEDADLELVWRIVYTQGPGGASMC